MEVQQSDIKYSDNVDKSKVIDIQCFTMFAERLFNRKLRIFTRWNLIFINQEKRIKL